jgi:hypothetical protein
MMSHEIETYRDFRVRILLAETPTHWLCEITFEQPNGAAHRDVPPAFGEDAKKSEVGALNFSMAMQSKARGTPDEWLARDDGR